MDIVTDTLPPIAAGAKSSRSSLVARALRLVSWTRPRSVATMKTGARTGPDASSIGPSALASGVSRKSAKIAALIESCRGRELDAHYLGYFECFNRALFYESHDVLEELWLQDRHGPEGNFYKGLIQLAGAFVHLRQHTEPRPRLRPAAALFKLASANLRLYPAVHRQLEVSRVLSIIEDWLMRLETGHFSVNPLADGNAPRLELLAGD